MRNEDCRKARSGQCTHQPLTAVCGGMRLVARILWLRCGAVMCEVLAMSNTQLTLSVIIM